MGREPKADSIGGRALALLRRKAPGGMTTGDISTALELMPGRVSTALGNLSDRNLVRKAEVFGTPQWFAEEVAAQ